LGNRVWEERVRQFKREISGERKGPEPAQGTASSQQKEKAWRKEKGAKSELAFACSREGFSREPGGTAFAVVVCAAGERTWFPRRPGKGGLMQLTKEGSKMSLGTAAR